MNFPSTLHSLLGFRRCLLVLTAMAVFGPVVIPAVAQVSPQCTTADISPATVASTGLAERIATVTIACTGGTPGSLVAGDVFVTLNTNITNSLDQNGNPEFISVSGAGAAVTGGQAALITPRLLQVPNVSYTVPVSNTTLVNITISGIRASVASIQNGVSGTTVTASLHWVGNSLSGIPVNVATGTTQLLSSVQNSALPCSGSPLPGTMDFPTFVVAGMNSSAIRVSEASATSFAAQDPTSTNGVRIVVQLSGYPTGTQLFVPSAIVGNSGSTPTSAGEFGTTAAIGAYMPNSNQLLLSLVTGTDRNGAGGTLVYPAPVAAGTFTAVTELTVTNGSAYAVYEVVDQNPSVLESAQIPVFEASPAYSCANPAPPSTLAAMEAPVSTVSIATMTDPVPRYIASPLGSDCQVIGDCNAAYDPVLAVNTAPVNIAGASGGSSQNATISVVNNGGGALGFTVSTAYQSGANWLSVSPTAADDALNATLTLAANPAALQPGTYTATVTVNAGTAGTASVLVIFAVGPPGPTIQSLVSAASFQPGAIAPGSYVALFGLNLAGANVGVTFNNLTANVIYDSAGQINLIVPPSLSGQTAAVLVTVDGQASNSFNVALTPNEPAIFTPGILNSDSSVNAAANPATLGTFVQVYLTGLGVPVAAGSVTLNMGNQTGIGTLYAGPQGTLPALDQINVIVPVGLTFTGNSTPLTVCVTDTTGQSICSNAVSLYVQ